MNEMPFRREDVAVYLGFYSQLSV